MRLSWRFLLVLSPLTGSVQAGEASPLELEPTAEVARFAASHGLSLTGWSTGGATEEARPGDRMTVLFAIQDGVSTRQWLAEFRAAALTVTEAKSKPGSGLGLLGIFQTALHTDTGHEHRFMQSPAALEIHTFGPFPADGSPRDVKTRVLATREYLAHGLTPMADIELRLRNSGKKNPGLSFMFRASYGAGQMTAARARAAEAGFTVEDERAFAAGLFALVQFGNLAFRTEGIDAITRGILDTPGPFTGTFINLDWPAMRTEDAAAWGLPGGRVFRVPYKLNSKTEARGMIFITDPRPPLQNMAGIIGATVDETSKATGRRLVLRVLAAQRVR